MNDVYIINFIFAVRYQDDHEVKQEPPDLQEHRQDQDDHESDHLNVK